MFGSRFIGQRDGDYFRMTILVDGASWARKLAIRRPIAWREGEMRVGRSIETW